MALESCTNSDYIPGINNFDPRTQEVLRLSVKFCKIPSTSMPPHQANFEAIQKVKQQAVEYAESKGLRVIEIQADDSNPNPFLIISFNENDPAIEFRSDAALVGHLDVVREQNKKQFTPYIDGNMLVGRGSADMKTVVATQLAWMAGQQAKPGSKPPIITVISFCEENASLEGHNTKTAIQMLRDDFGAEIGLAIVGERTGEMESGQTLPVGPICEANKGWRWYLGTGIQRFNGMSAFETLVSTIQKGRKKISNLNAHISSQRMKEQGNWKSGFVNPFVRIGSDKDLNAIIQGTVVRISQAGGKARHSAAVSANEMSTIEEFWEIVEHARTYLGEAHVKLQSLSIGAKGNFNTITGKGEMVLVINDKLTIIDQWKEKLEQENRIFTTRKISFPQRLDSAVPVFGLDIREIPEHTEDVREWVEDARRNLGASGINLETLNDGSGWECPKDNLHLLKLRNAYERVMADPSPRLGKLHGNDGRFFHGNAVVWGQTGINPHGPNEAHYIPSILKYLEILDKFSQEYTA